MLDTVEPAILHALTAIFALHETILQRSFLDEKRKAQATEFSLGQCNLAIASLTNDSQRGGAPNIIVALSTCKLFTCFETLQGRTDSAVKHAFQGRRLLEASGRADPLSITPSDDYVEHIRPLVDRLEVQATTLLDKEQRPEVDTSDKTARLPHVKRIFTLENAHDTLHIAMNSIVRFIQGFHPTAPKDHIAVTLAEKYLRYAPWFQQWEYAFTLFLIMQRETISQRDLKCAMVLKANHLVGTMPAVIDQSVGPEAYDPYGAEFQAIVELSTEVLATSPYPPLLTLHDDNAGNPFLCFSLWVTEHLWMIISRCRNSRIRQSASFLLSQNPRQEGLWHSGPVASEKKKITRTQSLADNRDDYEAPEEIITAGPAANMRARAEWLRAKVQHRTKAVETGGGKIKGEFETPPIRFSSTCTGRCSSISTLAGLKSAQMAFSDHQPTTPKKSLHTAKASYFPSHRSARV
ncbi:Hypothetical protein R9X50_00332400 [Acrodontium crateriforme]|uniref:Uncharacterized protein n=1 Tax=Acrodontium crateriforme TaxID=150365 RepID=A0AAQ3R9T4_9PEZI|nr:Hypothetical protein R9X50_00332400 [Acrodontium crateriforme]